MDRKVGNSRRGRVRARVRGSRYRRAPLSRKVQDAQHEAAHLVVGLVLGLRLRRAFLTSSSATILGRCVWTRHPVHNEASKIMVAAGVAWERRVTGRLAGAAEDLRMLRELDVTTRGHLRMLERAAWAILESRARMHAAITRALLDDDVTASTIRAWVAGS